ncbi:MAG TPA: hypothetical protein PKY82_11700 [Pyrinomonadaceae bacterium]|nr:hypothetical protein [Pyrinomonadaceae bacterium]
MDLENFKGAGGTSGGVFQFLIGLAMAVAGAYMLISRVTVTSGFWYWGGYNTFGLSLIPLIFGIGFVFFNGKSLIGWLLVFVSSIIIISGILMNLQIYFQSTSLFNTIIMIILFAGGIGLIARSIVDRE